MRTALFFVALTALPALADSDAAIVPMPADRLYVKECGACHTAYAPGFLPAASWRKLFSDLDRHFGEDASLDPVERDRLLQQVLPLALDGAGANRAIAARSAGAWSAAVPLRPSESPFFHFMHDEVPSSFWQRKTIACKSNCGACHTRADEGRYLEGEIEIPR